jgi:hypothetical protein
MATTHLLMIRTLLLFTPFGLGNLGLSLIGATKKDAGHA